MKKQLHTRHFSRFFYTIFPGPFSLPFSPVNTQPPIFFVFFSEYSLVHAPWCSEELGLAPWSHPFFNSGVHRDAIFYKSEANWEHSAVLDFGTGFEVTLII
ncbi:MAG: hypothetical protein GY821_01060 [Gammaproteobacteria bacterium]|nr:hypothetical protein [Gammaproteobacteria bacterium]